MSKGKLKAKGAERLHYKGKKAWIERQRHTKFIRPPLIALYVEDSDEALELSLATQSYQYFELLCPSSELPQFVACRSFADAVKRSHAEYILPLSKGSVLRKDALYNYATVFSKGADVAFCINPLLPFETVTAYETDTLLSCDYMQGTLAVRKTLLAKLNLPDSLSGDARYELALRVSEKTQRISFIHKPLIEAKPVNYDGKKAVAGALQRRSRGGWVCSGKAPMTVTVHDNLAPMTKFSVVVMADGNFEELRALLETIEQRCMNTRYELVVGDHSAASVQARACAKYRAYVRKLEDAKAIISVDCRGLNAAEAANRTIAKAKNAFVFLTDCKTMPMNEDFLEYMGEVVSREGVGAVGGTVEGDERTNRRGEYIRNIDILTPYGVMLKAESFSALGGFDKTFGDKGYMEDYCDRLIGRGRRVVLTPFARFERKETADKWLSESNVQRLKDVGRGGNKSN